MQVVAKSIDDIKPYENNPRNNDDAVDAVANSIREFGWQQPIVVDNDGVIVAGHTRYKAAKKLGLKHVPVVQAVHDDGTPLTDEEINAYRLADNKTGELATWNDELLEDELGGIDDIDMSNFGFPPLETIEEENSEAHDDEFDEDPPKEPKSKTGQIYKLGRHRLMCGDSTKIDDVKNLMGGTRLTSY